DGIRDRTVTGVQTCALPICAAPDVSARRPPPDELRRGAGSPLGDLRVGLQRARPRSDLPVLELRGPGPRTRAGSKRGPRHRALRSEERRVGKSWRSWSATET